MLIGLCGKPNSGKSEIRKLLEKRGFTVLNTKENLIKACSALTGIEEECFATSKGKEAEYEGVKLRKIMGEVQSCIENLFGDYHTIETSMQLPQYRGKDVVVDALRKSQTVNFEGIVVEVVSEKSIDTKNDFDQYERGLDGEHVDYIIVNDGDIEHLEYRVDSLLMKIGFL